MNKTVILQRAKEVLNIEATGIFSLIDRLDDHFIQAIELLYNCRGKVVVTGLGKSGLVCRKIAATFSSMGTPSFFLHAGDANHGDMGMIMEGDVVLAVSNSGETEEILTLIPTLKRIGVRIVAMTGNHDSTLSRAADVVLDAGVTEEACPLGLSPTASTTAALALGDALAVILLEKKGFKEEDFALRHPGGILGRKLLLRVEDLMHRDGDVPLVGEETLMKEAILVITSKRLGVTGVTDKRGDLIGVITDGDLRRGLQAHGDGILSKRAEEIMTLKPRSIEKDALASQALARMEENLPRPITSLFVVEKPGDRVPVGILHIHDLLKAGIV
ncbi:MAG TPA: KpsF/GutQ family sugar-phosphate isomerase [Candidatus Binatia bacterium]|nr:KpsF/GutQ family sugar-phosphate isomerase [Candidatus Binatia bacterium]